MKAHYRSSQPHTCSRGLWGCALISYCCCFHIFRFSTSPSLKWLHVVLVCLYVSMYFISIYISIYVSISLYFKHRFQGNSLMDIFSWISQTELSIIYSLSNIPFFLCSMSPYSTLSFTHHVCFLHFSLSKSHFWPPYLLPMESSHCSIHFHWEIYHWFILLG